jgi:hypothetical protein
MNRVITRNKGYFPIRGAEETGFEPARACLRAQGISNPPQWATMRLLQSQLIIPSMFFFLLL